MPQINVTIPESWKVALEKEARKVSFDRDKTISYLDLIREVIKEKFNLQEED